MFLYALEVLIIAQSSQDFQSNKNKTIKPIDYIIRKFEGKGTEVLKSK
jgi:hypothetical protein